jgi:hypothetical protein
MRRWPNAPLPGSMAKNSQKRAKGAISVRQWLDKWLFGKERLG